MFGPTIQGSPSRETARPDPMSALTLPAGFPFPKLVTDLAEGDTMFDGRSEHYLGVGLSALRVIEAAFLDAPAPRRILDLPCGFGRVTRMLRARYPSAEITVCDLDRLCVDFTAAHFSARGVYSKPNFRELELGAVFDLIWVGSLLTHLPEHQTRQFLDFAVRQMGPNCRLIVTSHGGYVAERLQECTYGLTKEAARGLLAQFRMEGYGFRGYSGDQWYGISLSSRTWFEQVLSGSPLCLQAYYERGWDRHQDALVLRRRSCRGRWGRAVDRLQGRSNRTAAWFEQSGSPPIPPPAAEQAALDEAHVAGFDEAWYLATFPDVATAVDGGVYPSGLAHYKMYGWAEGRPFCDPALTFDGRTPSASSAYCAGLDRDGIRQSKINEIWSSDPEAVAVDAGWYWMAHPAVRARINTLVSGDPTKDAYDRLAQLLRDRGWTMPIGQSISLGCGFGALERDLAARGMIDEIDAYDVASGAVAEAVRQAKQSGLLRVRYHVADLEAIRLPAASVDVVFAHSSVHHVARLEALYAVVQRTLRPDGIFHLHEFVGPTRFQWTDAQLDLANAFLDSLPPRLRRLPSGQPKERLRRPTVAEMISADPSEAVRSADLVGALQPFFDVIEERQIGGTLLHLALGQIAQNFDPNSPEDLEILESFFEVEDAAMKSGLIGSDFAVITATPKPIPNTRRIGPAWPGNAMLRSIAAKASLLFPPARRLHDTIQRLNDTIGTVHARQDLLADELAALRMEQSRLAAAQPPTVPAVASDETKSLHRSRARPTGLAHAGRSGDAQSAVPARRIPPRRHWNYDLGVCRRAGRHHREHGILHQRWAHRPSRISDPRS